MTDQLGVEIPPRALTFWQRTPEVQALLTAITRVSSAIKRAQVDKDAMFSEVCHASTLSYLTQAYTSLKVAKPYAVCPECEGRGTACRLCKGKGLLSQFRWDRAVSDETKSKWLKEHKK